MSGKENFDWGKFFSGFQLFNPVSWGKRLVSVFWNLVVYGVIIAVIMGFGYYSGYRNRPIKIDLGYNKEAVIEINAQKDYIHIQKDGNVFIKNKEGKILKQIAIKDVPNLQKALIPFGLDLKPFVLAGYSSGLKGDGQLEGGIGLQIAHAWRLALDAFITTCPAVYAGISYQVTDNFYVGGALGRSLRDFDDVRGIIYMKWRF